MPRELLYESKVPTSKERYVGIEIEFLLPRNNSKKLETLLLDNLLEWNVHLGTDGSVRDTEWQPVYNRRDLTITNLEQQFLGKEIRILSTESEAPEIINSVCKILKECGAKVNATCGLHVHLDMRNRNVESVYENFYRTQDILFKMQPAARKCNTYCKELKRLIKEPRDRYYGINKVAYKKYNTLEIRLHEGSISAKDIKLWVLFLINICNMNKVLKRKVSDIKDLNLTERLEQYVSGRISKYTS